MSECVIAGMGGGGEIKIKTGSFLPNSDTDTIINLGSRPKFVLIQQENINSWAGFGTADFRFGADNSNCYAKITDTGFSVGAGISRIASLSWFAIM